MRKIKKDTMVKLNSGNFPCNACGYTYCNIESHKRHIEKFCRRSYSLKLSRSYSRYVVALSIVTARCMVVYNYKLHTEIINKVSTCECGYFYFRRMIA